MSSFLIALGMCYVSFVKYATVAIFISHFVIVCDNLAAIVATNSYLKLAAITPLTTDVISLNILREYLKNERHHD